MGHQRINPEVEAQFGRALRAAALAGGHRAKLPPDFGGQYVSPETSLKERVMQCIREGDKTSAEVNTILGQSGKKVSGALSTLYRRGRVTVIRQIEDASGRAVNVYTVGLAV